MSIPIYKSYLKSLSKKSDEVLLKEQVEKSIEEKSEQMLREQVEKLVKLYVISIMNNVIEAAESKKTSYTHDLKDSLYTTVYLRMPNCYMKNDVKKNIVPDIVEDLKTKFPDCVVTADPDNTYIYISWE